MVGIGIELRCELRAVLWSDWVFGYCYIYEGVFWR